MPLMFASRKSIPRQDRLESFAEDFLFREKGRWRSKDPHRYCTENQKRIFVSGYVSKVVHHLLLQTGGDIGPTKHRPHYRKVADRLDPYFAVANPSKGSVAAVSLPFTDTLFANPPAHGADLRSRIPHEPIVRVNGNKLTPPLPWLDALADVDAIVHRITGRSCLRLTFHGSGPTSSAAILNDRIRTPQERGTMTYTAAIWSAANVRTAMTYAGNDGRVFACIVADVPPAAHAAVERYLTTGGDATVDLLAADTKRDDVKQEIHREQKAVRSAAAAARRNELREARRREVAAYLSPPPVDAAGAVGPPGTASAPAATRPAGGGVPAATKKSRFLGASVTVPPALVKAAVGDGATTVPAFQLNNLRNGPFGVFSRIVAYHPGTGEIVCVGSSALIVPFAWFTPAAIRGVGQLDVVRRSRNEYTNRNVAPWDEVVAGTTSDFTFRHSFCEHWAAKRFLRARAAREMHALRVDKDPLRGAIVGDDSLPEPLIVLPIVWRGPHTDRCESVESFVSDDQSDVSSAWSVVGGGRDGGRPSAIGGSIAAVRRSGVSYAAAAIGVVVIPAKHAIRTSLPVDETDTVWSAAAVSAA